MPKPLFTSAGLCCRLDFLSRHYSADILGNIDMFNDLLLRNMYVAYDTPCDRLVSDPELLRGFTDDYCSRSGDFVEPASLSHHMLNLRRLGEAKKGLPRLRRRYRGRNA